MNDKSVLDIKDINDGTWMKKFDLIKPIDCVTNQSTPISYNLCHQLNFHSIDLSQMDYSEIDELDNLKIGTTGTSVKLWEIPFDFLMSVCDYDKKNKILYFTDSFFINKNILLFLSFSNIYINIETKNKQKYSYKFNLVTTYIDDNYRNKLKSDKNEHSYIINTFTTNISSNTNKIPIDNMMSIKGIYLFGDKIKNVKLMIGDDVLFDYNHNFIKKIGLFKKDVSIAKKDIYLYYIPISIKNDRYLDICRFENVNLVFDKEYNGKVIGYGRNFIYHMSGLIGLVYG